MILRAFTIFLLSAFIVSSSGVSDVVQAQTIFSLPAPGSMVTTSAAFSPLQFKGIQVDTQNPLKFDFLIDKGQSHLRGQELKDEVSLLAKYFLTCLTVPESDLWVNLSPYEKDRIAPEIFGVTQMGKDLLEQDYLLKQIVASITYPDHELGKYFWQKVYKKAYALYGRTDIPISAFNKVWIVPKSAEVYAHGNSAFVVHSELDVMLETDYLALRNNLDNTTLGLNRVRNQDQAQYSKFYSQIMREVILPALRKEVNEGKNFATVRQVYNAMILATWYKRHLKDSLLGRMYVGKNKVNGVDVSDKNIKEEIFQQYLISFKKRVYNYIKEDYDPATQMTVPRQYVSGGMDFVRMGVIGDEVYHEVPFAPSPMNLGEDLAMASVNVSIKPEASSSYLRSALLKLAMMIGVSMFVFLPVQSTQAAVFTPQSDGTVIIKIQKGDILSKVARPAYRAYMKANPDHQRLDLHRTLWGPKGLIQVLFGGQTKNVNLIYPKDVFTVGTPTESKVTLVNPPPVPEIAVQTLPGPKLAAPALLPDNLGGSVVTHSVGDTGTVDALTVKKPVSTVPLAAAPPPPPEEGQIERLPEPKVIVPGFSAVLPPQVNTGLPAALPPSSATGGLVDNNDPLKIFESIRQKRVTEVLGTQVRPNPSLIIPQAEDALDPQAILKRHQEERKKMVSALPTQGQTVENTVGGSGPPDPDEFWVLGAIGLAAAVLLGIGGIKARRYILNTWFNNTSKPSAIISSAAPSANRSVSNQDWGFNVDDQEGPHLPNDEELDWARNPTPIRSTVAQQPPKPVLKSKTVKKSGLQVMDFLAIGLSAVTGLATVLLGGDILVAAGVVAVMFFATRPIYALLLWLHEIAHLVSATFQSSKDWKKIWTLRNIFGNYGIVDWLRVSIPFLKSSRNAGVDLDFLLGKSRQNNQTAGFVISVGTVVAAFVLAAVYIAWPPLFVSIALASLFLLFNSWQTDIKDPSSQGRIECGDSGIIWLNNQNDTGSGDLVEDFFPQFIREGQNNMRTITSLRGDQGQGIFTWGKTENGDIVPIIIKMMKSKRGKPVTIVTQLALEDELKDKIKGRIRPLSGAVREIMTHDRFLTQGTPSQRALHPHLGKIEQRMISFYDAQGNYHTQERTIVSVVIENGDNDNHQLYGELIPTKKIREYYPRKFHMPKKEFIEPNAQHPKGYYDYLPTGDAPPLALQFQYRDNMGDWLASSRFAAGYIFYQNIEQSMDQNLSEKEEDVMGDFFRNVYEHGHEGVLIRPKLRKKNKTLQDSWVTQDMARKYPELAFQYNALEDFREDLKRSLMQEVNKTSNNKKSSDVGRILIRLQALNPSVGLETKISHFVDMAVERFFTADILRAAIEVDELTVGTGQYGVRVLSSKYPERGIFWSRGQSLALGENMQEGYMAYNSEHTALMSRFGDVPPVNDILFLNSEGQGQITESYYDNDSKKLKIRAYSPEKRRLIREDELKEWRMELTPDNKYYKPLIERDPDDLANQDIADIPRAIDDTEKSWDDPESFNRQTMDAFFNKVNARYVERYIKDNSRYYKVMHGELLSAISEEASRCQGASCSEEQTSARRAFLLRAVQNNPKLITYLRGRLDQLIAHSADAISQQIIKGTRKEDDLYPLLVLIDNHLSVFMKDEIRKLVEKLIAHNSDFLNNFESEDDAVRQGQDQIAITQGEGLPVNESAASGDADLFISGLEDSLWLGSENLKAMLQVIFPLMVIETDSTNKALNLKPNDRHKVGRRTIALVVSKSGATSPTKNLVPILKSITPGNVFIMTGRVDTLMGLSLGQRYYKEAPFSKRIFTTGNYYPSEVNSTSEVELLDNQIEMVLNMVERMKKIYPDQKPWGMDLSVENIQKLQEWKRKMLEKSEHLTGFNNKGVKIYGFKENKEIIENGKLYGKILSETAWINLIFRGFVFSVIYLGTPVIAFFGFPHLIGAMLDTILVCTMPWWMTRVWRAYTKRVQAWGRMGPPTVVIGDTPVLHQLIESSASKRGAMAIATMDAAYHGGNPQDHFGPRFLHRVRRGASVLIFGLPEEPYALSNVLMTVSQSNIRNDMSLGIKIWDRTFGKWFKGGPEIFTIGHGDIDPTYTQHHMNIGPPETVTIGKDGVRRPRPDVPEVLADFYTHSFELLDRHITYNVFFNEAYDWATKPWPSSISWLWRMVFSKDRIWKPWESLSKTGVLSTPSPIGGPKNQLPPYHDEDRPYALAELPVSENKTSQDPAQTALRKGGIDMNSRLMDLKVNESPNSRFMINDRDIMIPLGVERVTPDIVSIVPITPNRVKAMLGEVNLN